MNYPTKKEILKEIDKEKYIPNQNIINIIKNWKKNTWRNYVGKINCNRQKASTLVDLINQLINNYESFTNNEIRTFYRDNQESTIKIRILNKYEFNKSENTIYIDKQNPSIISTLHEFAHWLSNYLTIKELQKELNLKDEELFACSWSIYVFKEVFPTAYKKLVWEKHTLRRK